MPRSKKMDGNVRGEIPTIKLGKLLRVPKSAFDRLMECEKRGPGKDNPMVLTARNGVVLEMSASEAKRRGLNTIKDAPRKHSTPLRGAVFHMRGVPGSQIVNVWIDLGVEEGGLELEMTVEEAYEASGRLRRAAAESLPGGEL